MGGTAKEHAMPPRISVVMIFFNSERYITEAIDSVLAQTFTDFELLLVDDGSTDTSSAIARDYVDRSPTTVRYLEHEGHANRGMSAARNLGLRNAVGEFVALIDSDDVWRPNKLAEQLHIMELHPGLGMVCGAVRYWESWAGGKDRVVPSGHIQDCSIPPPEAMLRVYPLGTGAAPCPSDLLMRRHLVMSLGGFEEQFSGPRQLFEDQAFLAKLYLIAPVYFSRDIWLNYRLHADSCVASVSRSGQEEEVRRFFFLWLANYLGQQPQVDIRVRTALRRTLWRYRHPHIYRIWRLADPIVARLRRGLTSLALLAAVSEE
jgi:glycosyltransferase involved in cell wall biosynthesis